MLWNISFVLDISKNETTSYESSEIIKGSYQIQCLNFDLHTKFVISMFMRSDNFHLNLCTLPDHMDVMPPMGLSHFLTSRRDLSIALINHLLAMVTSSMIIRTVSFSNKWSDVVSFIAADKRVSSFKWIGTFSLLWTVFPPERIMFMKKSIELYFHLVISELKVTNFSAYHRMSM